MNDKELYQLTTKYRQFIRILDVARIPNKRLYANYFQLVRKILLKDFKNIDSKFKALNISKYELGGVESVSKKIWVMWWQGEKNAPKIVQSNIKRLKRIFGPQKVVLITKHNYSHYTDISQEILNKFFNKQITFTSWSDIIRFNLLKNHGGIWIDSTVVVSSKITEEDILHKEFFSLCSNNKYRFVSDGRWTGWMIGGNKELKLFHYVNLFYQEYFKRHDNIIDYYIVDYAIEHYFNMDKQFQDLIRNQQRNWENSVFMANLFNTVPTSIIDQFNNDINYCVQKITYKKKIPKKISKDSLYYKIINNSLD